MSLVYTHTHTHKKKKKKKKKKKIGVHYKKDFDGRLMGTWTRSSTGRSTRTLMRKGEYGEGR